MAFREALRARTRDHHHEARRWLFVPYDQLTDAAGPLSREPPGTLGILVVECPEKAARRPYHRQKLALLLTNLRHFALEQAARGVLVRHVVAPSYAAAVAAHPSPLEVMRPAERELRAELAPLVETSKLRVIPHEGWLTTTEHFRASQKGPPWRMDAFYRHVRKSLRILMDGEQPLGGRFSFDAENRKPWNGEPPAPAPPLFAPDDITQEVCALVEARFARHPGAVTPQRLPATADDAERLWDWARRECLPSFGPFEDAMSTRSSTLFHTQVSALLNLQRLRARRLVEDVAADQRLPLASREGFIRQLLGWREYVRHVHEATDGFRVLAGVAQPTARAPGDGGYTRWAGEPWPTPNGGDGGSLASHLGTSRPLPPAFWGAPSGLRCLDTVIADVWRDGYGHHITRLMVLSNLAALLDVSPRELTDWFWAAYTDAYDWVVEPNAHGMGVFGVGELLTTKPYVAGAAYIDRMSDYCDGCRFDPKSTCPITPLYWAYLGRHRETLKPVQRLKLPLASEAKRTASQRERDARTYDETSATLLRSEELTPPQKKLL